MLRQSSGAGDLSGISEELSAQSDASSASEEFSVQDNTSSVSEEFSAQDNALDVSKAFPANEVIQEHKTVVTTTAGKFDFSSDDDVILDDDYDYTQVCNMKNLGKRGDAVNLIIRTMDADQNTNTYTPATTNIGNERIKSKPKGSLFRLFCCCEEEHSEEETDKLVNENDQHAILLNLS